jgi:uncharacterized protein (TIGR04255 family)
MLSHGTPLPEFSNPPLIEVALSLQFDSIPGLTTAGLGLLWNEFRATFPKVEEQLALDPEFEKFDPPLLAGPSVRFQQLGAPPVPRLWFLNEDGTELVQVQQTRFVNNWRRGEGGASYPRYEYIKEAFRTRLQVFRRFLEREKLSEVSPNQCEVTYVNHIVLASDQGDYGRLDDVLTVWKSEYNDSFLHRPEDVSVRMRYTISDVGGKRIGRLHVKSDPAVRRSDQRPIILLSLTARGDPLGEGLAGVDGFFDLGHEWVVRAFASLTTQRMHELWGRKQ